MKHSFRLALLVFMLALVVFFSPQTAPAAETVGTPSDGTQAWEFFGRTDQNGPEVTHFGYLTHIFGLADEQLFSDPNTHTEATARFTFFVTTTLTSRHERGNVITTAAQSELFGAGTIYFTDTPTPGRDFNNPASFASGQPIVTFSIRYYNVLNVLAPDWGTSSAIADLRQRTADSFTLGTQTYRLGRRGLEERVSATGQGHRTQVIPLQASFFVGGNVVITGFGF